MADLSVAVFNMHWGRGRFVPGGGQPFDVVPRLRAWDADVFVLPEHFRPHGAPGLADPLRDDGYELFDVPFVRLAFDTRPRVETPGHGWWTLTVATRLPVIDHGLLPIGRWIHDPAGARAALRLGLDVDGTRVDLVGVHVSSKLWWAAPVVHLSRLRAQVASLRSGPAIVAGDCNLWGPAVERLLPGWKRAVTGRTFPAWRPHSQIDHVLANRHVIAQRGTVLEPTPSDHRAVIATLRVA